MNRRKLQLLSALLTCQLLLGFALAQAQETKVDIPPGHRVYSVKVAPIKFDLTVGDHVDLVGFIKDGSNDHRYDVLEDVMVFAMDQAVNAAGERESSLSFLVKVKDAERLAMADEHCALQVVERKKKAGPTRPGITLADGKTVTDELLLTAGKSRVLELTHDVETVRVSGARLIVQALAPKKIRVEAAGAGISTIYLIGKDWERRVLVRTALPTADAPQPTALSDQVIRIHDGETHRVDLEANIETLTVTNDSVVQVTASSPNAFQLKGLQPGRSKVLVESKGKKATISVVVATSTDELADVLKEIFPKLNIRLVGLRSSVVLLGEVDDAFQSSDIARIAEDYFPSAINRLTIRASQRPMTDFRPAGGGAGRGPGYNERVVEELAGRNAAARKTGRDEALKALAAEVKSLRRDVKRLIELLEGEKAGSSSADKPKGASIQLPKEMNSVAWPLTLDAVIRIGLSSKFNIAQQNDELVVRRTDPNESELDLERETSDYLAELEGAYWSLWASTRNLQSHRVYRDRWRNSHDQPGGGEVANDELNLWAQFAVKDLRERETKLRGLLGLAESDGRTIWPTSDPSTPMARVDVSAIEQAAIDKSGLLTKLTTDISRLSTELARLKTDPTSPAAADGQRRRLSRIRSVQLQLVGVRAALDAQTLELKQEAARLHNQLLLQNELLDQAIAERTKFEQRFDSRGELESADALELIALANAAALRVNGSRAKCLQTELALLNHGSQLLRRHQVRIHSEPLIHESRAFPTARFVVSGAPEPLASQIGKAAAEKLAAISHRWFQEEPSNWRQPCSIELQVKSGLAGGGATSFVFRNGGIESMRMTLQGDAKSVFNPLTHEIAHLVLADTFKTPLPRWLDEGFASLHEDDSERVKMRKLVQQYRDEGRLIPLKQLFSLRQYPKDAAPVFAQGHSLVEYLVDMQGEEDLAEFIRYGAETGEWVEALTEIYGFEQPEELELEWLDSL